LLQDTLAILGQKEKVWRLAIGGSGMKHSAVKGAEGGVIT